MENLDIHLLQKVKKDAMSGYFYKHKDEILSNMTKTIKIDGHSYERIKCPKCGAKVLFSHERQDFCPSCGSEIIVDTTSGRKETKLLSLRVLGIISIIGGIFGGIISTIWGIANGKIVELIWIIPLGITIGVVIPFIAYIAALIVALLLAFVVAR